MPARRCSTCGVSWPHHVRYASCKACDGKTDVIYNSDGVSQSEANHLEFEAYYRRHEEQQAKERAEIEAQALAELEELAAAVESPPDPIQSD